MQIQPPPPMQLNSPNGIDAQAGFPQMSGYITPDALMAYCSARLRGLDDQMQTAFAGQEKANADQELLGKLQSDVRLAMPDHQLDLSWKGGFPNNPKDNAELKGAYDAIKAEIKQLDPRDPLAKKLTAIADQLGSETQGGDFIPKKPTMSTDDWNTMITGALSSVSKDLSSGSELTMINLQSLMSQRQEAIQVCTNLVQAIGDQCNKIAENVGK